MGEGAGGEGMPELPEVETIRRGLNNQIAGLRIKSVQVKKARLVKGSVKKFIAVLTGNVFLEFNRRGKLLIAALKSGQFLLIHLKMTGQLIYQHGRQLIAGGHSFVGMDWRLPSRHTHIIISFRDGSRLFFNDLRQFGYMKIVSKIELEKELKKFGIEPLTAGFSLKNFVEIFANKKTTVKALLLNQKLIAGLGNIYADEVCFYAKVKPGRRVYSLTEGEIKKLYQGCRVILAKAVKARGTTFSDYVDADGRQGGFIKFLKVYGRKGEKCRRCRRGVIVKIKQGGRGTHYCPVCQC